MYTEHQNIPRILHRVVWQFFIIFIFFMITSQAQEQSHYSTGASEHYG